MLGVPALRCGLLQAPLTTPLLGPAFTTERQLGTPSQVSSPDNASQYLQPKADHEFSHSCLSVDDQFWPVLWQARASWAGYHGQDLPARDLAALQGRRLALLHGAQDRYATLAVHASTTPVCCAGGSSWRTLSSSARNWSSKTSCSNNR